MRFIRTHISTRTLGLDLSLNSTGYSYQTPSGQEISGRIRPGALRGPQRLSYLADRLREVVLAACCTTATVEDYAIGGKGKVFHIGEWGGVAKTLLWDHGMDIVLFSPSTLKKIVTGSGGPDKDKKRMLLHAHIHFPTAPTQNDEVDAYCLRRAGEALLYRVGPALFVHRVAHSEYERIAGRVLAIPFEPVQSIAKNPGRAVASR